MTHLGIKAFASSGVSGHKLARETSSNLCSFFCIKSLQCTSFTNYVYPTSLCISVWLSYPRTRVMDSLFFNFPNRRQYSLVFWNTSDRACSSSEFSFCWLLCSSSKLTSEMRRASAFSNSAIQELYLNSHKMHE